MTKMGQTLHRGAEDHSGDGDKEEVAGMHIGGGGDPEIFNKPEPGNHNHRQTDS